MTFGSGARKILSLTVFALSTSVTIADDSSKRSPQQVPPKAADADAPLPEGFPGATRPGLIEIKRFPAYRSAVAKGDGVTVNSSDVLFYPLFLHIQRNQVEMTAPVINTYLTPSAVEKPGATGEVTMEFLYPDMKLGRTGPSNGSVKVVDHPAAEFVCLGVQGGMSEQSLREGVAKLRGWLSDHKTEWVEAGPPRRLGYHGPMTPTAQRLWEIQLPVRAATPPKP